MDEAFKSGVFHLFSSRANLHLSYNPAGHSHCRLQNHHGYLKHHHRGMGISPGDVGEAPMKLVKQQKGCRMSCDVGKAAEGLKNELWRWWSDVRVGEWGGANPFAALPTSQLILQPFRCFIYVIGASPTSPGEPLMPLWWCLRYPWWFCNVQWLRPAGLYERLAVPAASLALKSYLKRFIMLYAGSVFFRSLAKMRSQPWTITIRRLLRYEKNGRPSCLNEDSIELKLF